MYDQKIPCWLSVALTRAEKRQPVRRKTDSLEVFSPWSLSPVIGPVVRQSLMAEVRATHTGRTSGHRPQLPQCCM